MKRLYNREADFVTQRHLYDFAFGGRIERGDWHDSTSLKQLKRRCRQDSEIGLRIVRRFFVELTRCDSRLGQS